MLSYFHSRQIIYSHIIIPLTMHFYIHVVICKYINLLLMDECVLDIIDTIYFLLSLGFAKCSAWVPLHILLWCNAFYTL